MHIFDHYFVCCIFFHITYVQKIVNGITNQQNISHGNSCIVDLWYKEIRRIDHPDESIAVVYFDDSLMLFSNGDFLSGDNCSPSWTSSCKLLCNLGCMLLSWLGIKNCAMWVVVHWPTRWQQQRHLDFLPVTKQRPHLRVWNHVGHQSH